MPFPQARVSFPGIDTALGVEFTLSRGVSPSVCTLFMLPQETLDLPPGTLRLHYGDTLIEFPGAAIDTAYLRTWRDGSRWRWSVQILDRRWAWKNRPISGTYNVRLSNGLVQNATRKTAQELASLLLQALGESDFDISRVPTSVYPPANWDGSSAADELAKLCDYIACEVVLGLDNRVSIWPKGVGGDAPVNTLFRHPQFKIRSRRVPNTIRLIGSPDRYQSKILLEAIAREASGNHERLDEASYTSGLTMADELPWSFPGITDDADRAGAFESLYRWFRVYRLAEGGLVPGGCPITVTEIGQLLPLYNTLIEAFYDLDEVERVLPNYLEGDFWAYSDSPENQSEQRYVGNWTLQTDWGVVATERPVFKLDSNYQPEEPNLYLTTAFNVRAEDGSYARLDRSASAGGYGEMILDRPELFQTFRSTYDWTTRTGVVTNQSTVLAEADAYLALFQQQFADSWAYEVKYGTMLPVQLDGRVSQVRWECWATVDRPTVTHVSVNDEFDVHNLSDAQRRRREVVDASL
jgi:hypothetical protein